MRNRAILPVLAAGLCASLACAAPDTLSVGAFSAARPGVEFPPGWETMVLDKAGHRTQYDLVEDGGTTVLRAVSRASASGLNRNLRADPAEYPLLRWRWKVGNLVKGSDLRKKQGDDFPARLYVMFDYPLAALSFGDRMKLRLARAFYGPDLPAATLCYVWDGTAPAGTIAPSAYTDRVRIIVVESGAARVNQWVNVERDLYRDFKAAFGQEPPELSAVALMTDTDNTGASATAWYGDISLHKRAVSGPSVPARSRQY